MTSPPFLRRGLSILKQLTIEPYLFFCMFGYDTTLVTMQSLLMYKSCRSILNLPDSVCDNLEDNDISPEQDSAVQYGNNIYVGIILMSTVPAVVVATFLGPWSDKYSRKYPLIIAATGILIDFSINAALSTSPDASPYLFFISATMSGCTGGFIMAMSATYSYLSDVTDERSRPSRFAILEFFTLVSIPIGSLVGGQVFKAGGYFAVLIIGPCTLSICLLWATFWVKETKSRGPHIMKSQMIRDLFRFDNVKDSVRTCLQKRPGNLRSQIWLLVLVSCSIRIVEMGTFSVSFAYTKIMYGWNVTQYSNVVTLFTFLNAIATLVLVPILNKKLLLHEAAVGLIGMFSLMAKMVLMSVAFQPNLLYFAWFSGLMSACGVIAVRSRLSKIVSKDELGKAFSLLATCESLTPVIGTLIFTQVLNASTDFFPGLPFAASAVLLVPAAIVFLWMMKMPTVSFSQFEEQEDSKHMTALKTMSEMNLT